MPNEPLTNLTLTHTGVGFRFVKSKGGGLTNTSSVVSFSLNTSEHSTGLRAVNQGSNASFSTRYLEATHLAFISFCSKQDYIIIKTLPYLGVSDYAWYPSY